MHTQIKYVDYKYTRHATQNTSHTLYTRIKNIHTIQMTHGINTHTKHKHTIHSAHTLTLYTKYTHNSQSTHCTHYIQDIHTLCTLHKTLNAINKI